MGRGDRGGLEALKARTAANMAAIEAWVAVTPWVDFLAAPPGIRSPTSVCLSIVDPWFQRLPDAEKAAVPKRIEAMLEAEGVAYDINGYRSAPPGLRVWAGATVERDDLESLCQWLDWAYARARLGEPVAA